MFQKHLFFLLSLALIFPSIAVPAASSAATSVSGSIINPVWTAENSPYVIAGTMEVAKGATLVMEPGTQVRFNQGAKIVVHGILKIQGTDSDPVMLSSNLASPASGDWSGIEFAEDSDDAVFVDGQYYSGSIIKGAIIKFSEGIKCDDASPYISHNQFINNKVGIYIYGDNASAGGLVLSSSSAADNSEEIKTISIEGNTFNDNSVGIKIERNNGRSYVATPVGYSYIGGKSITSRISGNYIDSNYIGIQVIKGDNNVISGNILRYNRAAAVSLESGSAGNMLEKNTINNNEMGVISASSGLFMVKNEVKYNSNSGLAVSAEPKLIRDNNIYGNSKYNIQSGIFGLKVANNYWGSSISSKIDAGIYLATSSSVVYSPALSSVASLSGIIDPIIDSYATTTLSFKQIFSGVKPLDADVYINGQLAVKGGADMEWTYAYILQMGNNEAVIYYQDKSGNKSQEAKVGIFRAEEAIIPVPKVDPHPSKTEASSIVITGTKMAGTSVWVDSKMVIGVNDSTTWQYTLPLGVGVNRFNLMSTDANNKSSVVSSISIERYVVQDGEIISQEKSLSAKIDSALVKRLSGRLLLQVENKGYIWYVNPADGKRYFISQTNALKVFSALSLGITEANLNQLPAKGSSAKGNVQMRERLKGKLLLRVEKGGLVSYIDLDGYRHDISQANLMDIFRGLSLGISNENIRKISVGGTK